MMSDPKYPSFSKLHTSLQYWCSCFSCFSEYSDDEISRWPKIPPLKPGSSVVVKLSVHYDRDIAPKQLTLSQASKPCTEFTPTQLLKALNKSAKLRLTMSHSGVSDGIRHLISKNLDYGTAYAWFRTALFIMRQDKNLIELSLRDLPDVADYDESLTTRIQGNSNVGDEHILPECKISEDGQFIENPLSAKPRRLWDLYSNRVIPYDWHVREPYTCPTWGGLIGPANRSKKQFVAISHSWTADMKAHTIPINRHQWPVPLPVEDHKEPQQVIEAIRQQLINTTIPNPHLFNWSTILTYVWLDILCLRQSSLSHKEAIPNWQELESIRHEEWKIDVPTIGIVYDIASYVVCYMNGIGREFRSDLWEDPRHWVNRIWTMQEYVPKGTLFYQLDVLPKPIIMGMPSANIQEFEKYQPLSQGYSPSLHSQILPDNPQDHLLNIVKEIARRHSTTPYDQIAVLACMVRWDVKALPIYSSEEPLEAAWTKLLDAMGARTRSIIFFMFPPVDGDWVPAWDQLVPAKSTSQLGDAPMTQKTQRKVRGRPFFGPLGVTCHLHEEPHDQYHKSWHSTNFVVKNLTINLDSHPLLARQLHPEDKICFTKKVFLWTPIPAGTYTLVSSLEWGPDRSIDELGVGMPCALCLPDGEAPGPGMTYRKIGIGIFPFDDDVALLEKLSLKAYESVGLLQKIRKSYDTWLIIIETEWLDEMGEELIDMFPNHCDQPFTIFR